VADFYRQSGRIFPCRWQDANGICIRRFNIVPDNYIADAERYVADERARFDFSEE
jgi:hypothetical protein